MRAPWFSIIEVFDERGPSMADLCKQVTEDTGASLAELRGSRATAPLVAARRKFFELVRVHRPDLSSQQVGKFIGRDGSVVRQNWRAAEREQAA